MSNRIEMCYPDTVQIFDFNEINGWKGVRIVNFCQSGNLIQTNMPG